MKFHQIFIPLLFLLFSKELINSQEIETLNIDDDINIEVTKEGRSFNLIVNATKITTKTNFLAISTTPEEFKKPAFIYVAYGNDANFASPDNRVYSSQEIGRNIIYISKEDIKKYSSFKVFISSLEETKIRLQAYCGNSIAYEDYPLGFRHKLKLSLTPGASDDSQIHFELKKGFEKTKKVLFYCLGEYSYYYHFTVTLRDKDKEIQTYKNEERFENGYGAIVEITPDMLGGTDEVRIRAEPKLYETKYKDRKVEFGYEIVDNVGEPEDQREVNIWEHVYGMAENETCYKVKNLENRPATMLFNTKKQGALFNIRNSENEVVYSLDVFHNYFIRLPKEFYDKNNCFCFKHINYNKTEEETYGEVSYDFQIYYEDELAKYQLFISPLINGKFYTHTLNKGDIMIYRNSRFHYDNRRPFFYSANMVRIRGNPKLYGFTCNEYPNCAINSDDLKNKSKVEKILPLNMYYINNRLNAEGNTAINKECSVNELRKQYMSIVSCESDEGDPNKGECKYTIEINNGYDTIYLIPEITFTTALYNRYPDSNQFELKYNENYETIKYFKIYFTVLVGNAEIIINKDEKTYTSYFAYKKEIFEITKELRYRIDFHIDCTEPALIQLKYEVDTLYKGYEDLMPNEVNIVTINKETKTYYNMFNPHYYFPLNNEKRNNDFYYRIIPMDCTMNIYDVSHKYENVKELEIISEKNKLYEYLTTYGFYGEVNEFINTAYKGEQCTLIVYNGEISEKRPLLVNADFPHKSTTEETYYIFPMIFSPNYYIETLIEFKIYNKSDDIKDELYSVEMFINEQLYEKGCINLTNDDYIYIPQDVIKEYIYKNYVGRIYLKLIKKYPKENYYITTNFISPKISIEYFYPNKEYIVNMFPGILKYFYTKISKNGEGKITFKNLNLTSGEFHAKLVDKRYFSSVHNYNGRVSLPKERDSDPTFVISMTDGMIKYDNKKTTSNNGYEIYFNVDYRSVTNLSQFSFYYEFQIIEDDITDLNYEKTFYLDGGKTNSYKIAYSDKTKEENIVIISTSPNEYVSPGLIYIGKESSPASKEYNYKSVQPGINQIIISKDYFLNNEIIYLDIQALFTTTINFKISLVKEISLEKPNIRTKVKLSDSYIISYTKNETINSNKILIYSLGEKIDYFEMKVELTKNDGKTYNFEVKQIFENGFGAIVDYSSDVFNNLNNPKIYIKLNPTKVEHRERKIEVGYEIIDNTEEANDFREVDIWEHVYGIAEKETCYKINNIRFKHATMLVNTFSQSVLFNIKNSENEVVYSLDVFDNYFIRLPQEFYDQNNHFCFKHINSKESDEEIYGEISYDFQIYFDEELSKYQIYISPLINGKIYTHSLNKGDIMLYRNSYYEQNSDKKIYSANMLRIRGNPKLYAYICDSYPNCVI